MNTFKNLKNNFKLELNYDTLEYNLRSKIISFKKRY